MLSIRHKNAGLEPSSVGNVNVSTSARLYFRKYYQSWGVQSMASMRNADVNDVLATDFNKAEPIHRFRLRSGEIAEIRKSKNFYMIAKVQGNTYDLIVIQSTYKEAPEAVRKHRLERWTGNQSGTSKW